MDLRRGGQLLRRADDDPPARHSLSAMRLSGNALAWDGAHMRHCRSHSADHRPGRRASGGGGVEDTYPSIRKASWLAAAIRPLAEYVHADRAERTFGRLSSLPT